MHQKPSNTEQLQHQCNPIGIPSISRFRNVDELLEARSGASFYLQPWCIIGMPAFLYYPDKTL